MLSEKAPAIRNKLNLLDAGQVRILKKRLGISEEDLRRVVEKVGDSIATISKEVEFEKIAKTKSPAVDLPAAS
jgi:Protein of unknown function (DUF3606)